MTDSINKDPKIDFGITNAPISENMKDYYITYALSVIKSRALPDVRDGLKPVHRRILYSMHEQGNRHDKPHVKSASVVGDVLKSYHPHGDASIYDAMVRMGQPFNLRYMLIDGQGNFGSVDGDPPAAYRYTESRMSRLGGELLQDIDKETVDYIPTFDDTRFEPSVLPSRIPNLLMNGSEGIAVGMATKIPPHNLNELVGAFLLLLDNPNATIKDLMAHVKGPDFPTGGIIKGVEGIKQAYETGKGAVDVYARVDIEPMPSGKHQLIIDQIPYQVNKTTLLEKIVEVYKQGKIEGMVVLRDESDRTGMRIVIEVRRDVNPNNVLKRLLKHTQLHSRFHINLLALIGNQPKVFNLKEMCEAWLAHREEVIVRRTKYDLKVARAREHILAGLLIALDHLNEVITLIRSSRTVGDARSGLMEKFELSQKQADAILEMRLSKLTGLEREKVQKEYEEVQQLIAELEAILAHRTRVLDIIRKDLKEISKTYGDERKTLIQIESEDIDAEDLIPKENVVITLTHDNYIKRLPLKSYKIQHRGGKGIRGMKTKDTDQVEEIISTTTHHDLLFFTNKGKVYGLRAHRIPQAGRVGKGIPLINLISLGPNEKVMYIHPMKTRQTQGFALITTSKGIIKKTPLKEYAYMPSNGKIAIKLDDGNELVSARVTSGEDEIIMVTKNGQSIRFRESDVRSMGRTARGVKGMRLKGDDCVIGMAKIGEGDDVMLISRKGYGKRTSPTEFKTQKRGGSGIICYKVTDKTGPVQWVRMVNGDEEFLIITTSGILIRAAVKQVSKIGRSTQGVRVIRLNSGDEVANAALVVKQSELAEQIEEEETPAEPEEDAPKTGDLFEDEKTGKTNGKAEES
ncbi:DNA gyrase subunit A [bacterium]|nr:DNA gyrase subunit A [bacterium]